ncbi:hypothetical protein LSAT2_005660 [Lamellibrachia satsuma]|nr:hypothetical protein LSAT2_005660 [Lamellibrachia satsuma]
MTSKSDSKKTVSALLKDAYNAHVLTVESLTNHIEVLVRKCNRLTKFKDDILARGKDLQRRYDQLCEEHRRTQMTLAEVTTSETKIPSFLNLEGEIGARFPGVHTAGTDKTPRQDSLGLDTCDRNVSTGSSLEEGGRVEDIGGQRRLKLGNRRKRARYSEMECITSSRKYNGDSTKPTKDRVPEETSECKAGSDSPDRMGYGRQQTSRKTSTQEKRSSKHGDMFDQHTRTGQYGRTDVFRVTEMESMPEKGDYSHVLIVPETCYPDSCDPESSPIIIDTVDSCRLPVSADDPDTTLTKSSQSEKLNFKMQSEHKSPRGTLRKMASSPSGKSPRGTLRKMASSPSGKSPRGTLRKMASSPSGKCVRSSSVERKKHEDSVCSEDEDDSGDMSEVFLLPEVRYPGTFLSPLCNSTPVDSTTSNGDNCKVGSQQDIDATGCHENMSGDKVGCVTPKFPSLLDSPMLRSPKRKDLRRKSVGSPLLFDEDADGSANIRKGHRNSRACQMSDDAGSKVRTKCRDRLGGRSDVGQGDESVARGPLLSSSTNASKQADNIFFKEAEQETCSLNKTRKRKVDSKTSFTKMSASDNTSRKLVQMTLSQHLQPNSDRVAMTTVSRLDEEERQQIERAKKASLQDCHVGARCHSDGNTSSKEVPDVVTSEFKEPMTPHKAKHRININSSLAINPHCSHRQELTETLEVVPETVPEDWGDGETEEEHQLNGSVDPDLRLSAYIFTQSNKHKDVGQTTRSDSQVGWEEPESENQGREKGEREVDSCATSVIFAAVRRKQTSPVPMVDENLQDEDDYMKGAAREPGGLSCQGARWVALYREPGGLS